MLSSGLWTSHAVVVRDGAITGPCCRLLTRSLSLQGFEALEHLVADGRERVELGRSELVNQGVADVGDVLRGCRGDQIAPVGGDLDDRTPLIGQAPRPGDQVTVLHPAQVLGQAALLPVQQSAELVRPQPAVGCFGEMGQDLVVGLGQT